MSNDKLYETKVKDCIKSQYDGKFYTNNELPEIINAISMILKTEYNVDDTTSNTIITQYLYYGKDGKYFFNFKRKQTKKKNIILKY